MIRQTHIWGINDWIVGRATDGFEGTDWWERPGGMNHAVWLLGHLAMERRAIGRVLGGDFAEAKRDGLFRAGTVPDDVPREVDPAALLQDFHDTHERFTTFLEGLDEAALMEPIEIEFPSSPKNKLGALQFMLMHESYHVGQLGALRVMLGKGSWMPSA